MTSQVAVYSFLRKLPGCLKAVLPDLQFEEIQPGSPDVLKRLQQAEIIISDFSLVAKHINDLPNVKWIQGTYAGVESLISTLDKSKPFPSFPIARLTGEIFGVQMGEYVVTTITNRERNMFQFYEAQKDSKWAKEGNFTEFRSIMDLTIGIMGVGNIGRDIAKTLKSLNANVWGLVRNIPKDDEKLPFIDEYREIKQLPEFLQKCDYFINVFPSTPGTTGLLNGDMLKNCSSKETVFINIGRGSIIKETDLIKALDNRWLAAAILDVFEVEPLPVSNRLWKMPQVMVTPHISGVTRAQDVAKRFAENYRRYKIGDPLLNTIDFVKGY